MRPLKPAMIACLALAALAGTAHATSAGNITFNQATTACGPLAKISKVNRPAFITTFTSNNHYYIDVTTYLNDTESGSKTNYFYVFYFDTTAHTYSISAPGFPNLAGQIAGSFTGSISSSNFFSYNINVTLDCGSAMTGVTYFIGN